jgi:hypothetical protein
MTDIIVPEAKKQAVTEEMLTMLDNPSLKEIGLTLVVELKDGTKRKGIYVDLVVNPMNNPDYTDVKFLVFKTNKPEKDTLVFLPILHIATIAWSY